MIGFQALDLWTEIGCLDWDLGSCNGMQGLGLKFGVWDWDSGSWTGIRSLEVALGV